MLAVVHDAERRCLSVCTAPTHPATVMVCASRVSPVADVSTALLLDATTH